VESLPAIVTSGRAGDARAFGELVLCFQDMAFATCFARIGDVQLAQDAAQEAFSDAWLYLRQLQEPVAFPTWFLRVLVKHADRQTRVRRPLSISPDEIDALASDVQDTAVIVETDEQTRTVRHAVA